MAEQPSPSQPSLSGADHIRSLRDDDSIFKAFDSYPWKKDKAFMSGLQAILGDPNSDNPQGSPTDIATHARIFYYAQRIGVTVDFSSYQSWLAKHPDHQTPDILPEEYHTASSSKDKGKDAAESAAPTLSWQSAAPKADLFIDKSAAAQAAAAADGGGQPNYPMGFAEMIKLLQEGKEVPGIRQIPNTIARNPSVKPVGSRPVPKKPWEKENASQASEFEPAKTLDIEFPPIDPENSPLSSPEAVQS